MKNLLSTAFIVLGLYSGSVYACTDGITDPLLCETPEILFSEGEANVLKEKAQELNSVVKIYEYLKNDANYAVYHGARSSSLNTFLAMEGNDVDLASTLIALYRSLGVKARYVVGDVRLKRDEVANWVGVTNAALAVSILQNQGIDIVDDSDPEYVVFEHVWVEALVNFANYRGAGDGIVLCVDEDDQCKWVALDPSFKLKTYQPEYRELLAELEFNYDAYYHAESDQALRDKSPLEIFEESALEYLRQNHLGITLEDVIDQGVVVQEALGLLPSSLPFEVLGSVKRYDAIADHDLDEANLHDWGKNIAVDIYPIIGGVECQSISLGGDYSAADLSTKRLTVNWGLVDGQTQFATRLDGVKSGLSIVGNFTINCNGRSERITEASRFNIVLNVDASPFEAPIEIRYDNLIVGGYYLVATGGETSNWSQVRRAYQNLLSANKQFPLINHINGDVYVDVDGSGTVNAGDTRLLDNQEAQDALTGGLLYTAQALYYTRLKKESRRYSRLKNIISPIAAFAGVVSTTFEVELVDETPFAVLPGGLLIDLKGLRLNGSWVADEPETYSNETFKFLGHMASSLEHEIWQELTGYDAVSTMRGIQFALNANATLLDIHNNNTGDSYEQSLSQMGIEKTPPKDFIQKDYSIFNRRLVAWEYTGADKAKAGFYLFRGDLSNYEVDDYQAGSHAYNANNGFNEFFSSFDQGENQLNDLIEQDETPQKFLLTLNGATGVSIVGTPIITGPDANLFSFVGHTKPTTDQIQFEIIEQGNTSPGTYDISIEFAFSSVQGVGSSSGTYSITINPKTVSFSCNNVSYSDVTYSEALSQWESCFNAEVNTNLDFVNFLDRNVAFNPSEVFYKNKYPALSEYGIDFVLDVRNHMYFGPSSSWFNFTAPSALAIGPTYAFEVYIKDTVNASNDNLISSSYIIKNESMRLVAGGGYVPEGVPVDPATDTEGVEGSADNLDISGVTFNNEVFTDQNLVAIANNDVIRTPSTVDPVSTVTGNMYHDETDLAIAGKGLPYTFTRTYNSNETSTDGVESSNPNFLPLSQGWTHSYNMKLVANDYGQFPNYDASLAPENDNSRSSSITYVDERGGESNFLLDDSNAIAQPTSPRAGFDDLVLNSPSNGLHTITYSNGVQYIFDSQGNSMGTPGTVARLNRIEDAYGNQLNFGYTNNRLTSVTDNLGLSGRTGLVLEYYTSGENSGRLRFVKDWAGRQWQYSYTNSQLSSVVNPVGAAMVYTYVDDTHWLKDIIHPQDRNGKNKTMTFAYYENGQAYSYVDQNSSKESLIYDLFRRRTRVTNPRGLITEHYYDKNGALVKLVEPDKGILLFENNEDGLRYVKYDALGQRTRYSYHSTRSLGGEASDTLGQVTREEDALGNKVDYDYGIYGQLSKVKDKNGNTVTNEYYTTSNESTGAVTGKLYRTIADKATVNGSTYSNAVLKEFKYYADGTVKQQVEYIDPAQLTRKRVTDFDYSYNSDGSYTLTTEISGSGTTILTEKVFDKLWRLESQTVYRRTSVSDATPLALTTSYKYDDLGRLVSTTDPLGNIAETIYDANGKVYQNIARYKLQAKNNSEIKPECTIDPLYPSHHSCTLATNTYDAADRLIKTVDIKGAVTQYKYDPMGNVTKVTNDLGNSLMYEYDAMGRRTKVTDEKGYAITTTYDLAGRVTKITDANNKSITYTYDLLGRQRTITSPANKVTRFDEYDANGNLLRMTDPNGVAGLQPLNSQSASVSNVFDEFGRIVSSLSANNEQTIYTYDLLGSRTMVGDAEGQVTTFVYDDLGRLTTVKDPIIEQGTDKVVSITYDEVGNRLTYTDRLGEVTHYGYDKLNRTVLEDYKADNITAEKVYDQYGDMVSTSYGGSTYSYTYDVAHRPLSKTDSRSGRSLSWIYDSVGNLIQKTNYEGDVHTFTYDSSNRLVAMAVGDDPFIIHASYHYDPAGRLLSRILSNGAATLYNYNNDGFVTSIKQVGADGYQVDLREYEHDAVGNIKKLTVNGEVINYNYDPVYRLLSADSNNNSHDFSYTYDAVGNRLTKTASGSTQHYIYSAKGNRLEEVRQSSATGALVYGFDYDDNGSMIRKYNGNATLLNVTYDQRRLASVMAVDNASESLSFGYDANAYRIEKQSASETKQYYLEAEHLESVYDSADNLQANYLRGVVVDEIINGFERNSSTGSMENRTYHHDQVNSVVAVSDHNGQAVQQNSYGPFGESLASSGSSANSMMYTGRESDAESGLYYYRARYYDPELGRFISEDPIGFEGGANFYAYVDNNPLIYSDPMGKQPYASEYYQIQSMYGLINKWRAQNLVANADTSFTAYPVALLNQARQEYYDFQEGNVVLPYEEAIDAGWELQSDIGSSYHRNGDGFEGAIKLVSPGKNEFEGIYYPSTFDIIDDSVNRGTRNRFPQDHPDHKYDVVDWLMFGTGADDPSGIGDRAVCLFACPASVLIDGWGTSASDYFFGENPSANSGSSFGAGGGFVLYPSKINLNMSRSVYKK